MRLNSKNDVRKYLEELVIAIEQKALQDEDGNYYWLSPSLDNRVYLGLSHGSAMVLNFITKMFEENICSEVCKNIIIKAFPYILKNRFDSDLGLFPITIGDSPQKTQFSMCYGDLGVAYGLFRASMIISNQELAKSTNIFLENCINRTFEESFTPDASITYGASGVSQIFEKLYSYTGDTRFSASANYWQHNILKYRNDSSHELAGYQSWVSEGKSHMDVSFGWGIIGIGISLMRHLKKDLPSFDNLLMIYG